ncbi:hypothetical protein G9A89_021893 [Geosiphon pyriformis]|nr:hypothetical protein G9A89_021893 [Geosiphon pyriformis]
MAKKTFVISALFYVALLTFTGTVSANEKRGSSNGNNNGNDNLGINNGNNNGNNNHGSLNGNNNGNFNIGWSHGNRNGNDDWKRYLYKREPILRQTRLSKRGGGNGNDKFGSNNENNDGNNNHGSLNGNNNGNFNSGWSNGNRNSNDDLKRDVSKRYELKKRYPVREKTHVNGSVLKYV